MAIELKIPEVGESVTEVEIGAWLKGQGDPVRKDEPVVTLESEKATVELPAPDNGTLGRILKQKGQTAKVGETIAYLESAGATSAKPAKSSSKAAAEHQKPSPPVQQPSPPADQPSEKLSTLNPQLSTSSEASPARTPQPSTPSTNQLSTLNPQLSTSPKVMPAAQLALEQHNLTADQVQGTGPGGRILKEDVLRHVESQSKAPTPSGPTPSTDQPSTPSTEQLSTLEASPARTSQPSTSSTTRHEETVPMSRLRRTVAERLVEAQHTAALLTTFNEIDMTNVMALRKEHGEPFQKRYGVKLGFMSFFVKACIDALKQYPAINAEIRGTNIVYHNYYDIGVAVGSGKGLVVPVLRNAERMSFAEIETAIADFATRAKDNKLKLEELQGGTFTISNGGVYGSLLSTPIVNPPQSGVLGMHAIQSRPIALNDAVVIRPMMYIALTYDHRLVDGREAVSWLRRVKEVIETPSRMLMEV